MTNTENRQKKIFLGNFGCNLPLFFSCSELLGTGLDPLSGNGFPTAYKGWVSTDYVEIAGYVALCYELAAHRYLQSISFFDCNKRFVSGVTTRSVCGYSVLRGSVAVPESAKYARFINFTGSEEYKDPLTTPTVTGLITEEEYAAYKKAFPRNELKIVCIGDSLTEGDHGSHTAGVPCKSYKNYPYFLSGIMGCETVNGGRCGIKPSGMCELYEKSGGMGVPQADVVLLMLGTNGGLTVNGNTAERRAYEELLQRIEREKKPGCKVVLMTPPHATEIEGKVNFGYAPWVENAAEVTRELARQQGRALIDVYSESPITAENEEIYQPNDGLHLSDKGYEVLAGFIAEKLSGII